MQILFLDIDGVLNSHQFLLMQERIVDVSKEKFCPIASSNLNYLLDACSDLHIVISSQWRTSHTLEELKMVFRSNGINHTDRIIDHTPNIAIERRQEEISEWLAVHPEVKEYVVIDDWIEFTEDFANVFLTDPRHGLLLETVQAVIEFLTGQTDISTHL